MMDVSKTEKNMEKVPIADSKMNDDSGGEKALANVKADATAGETLPPLNADAEGTQENLETSGPPAKDNSTSVTNDNTIPANIGDLLSAKLAATAASGSSQTVDLQLLKNMVQARAAASLGDNMGLAQNPAAGPLAGSIDPSLLGKVLGIANAGGAGNGRDGLGDKAETVAGSSLLDSINNNAAANSTNNDVSTPIDAVALLQKQLQQQTKDTQEQQLKALKEAAGITDTVNVPKPNPTNPTEQLLQLQGVSNTETNTTATPQLSTLASGLGALAANPPQLGTGTNTAGLNINPNLISLLTSSQGLGGAVGGASPLEALQQLLKQQSQKEQSPLPSLTDLLQTQLQKAQDNKTASVPPNSNKDPTANESLPETKEMNDDAIPANVPELPKEEDAIATADAKSVESTSDKYRDFSKVADEHDEFGKEEPPGKEPPFPVKLHRILSNPEYSDMISWLPHGRSWRVLKPKAFEEKVIPLYFRHAKYASFMRQVNGWGFKRMTQGPDHNSYYHELFLRGMQHLCYKMRRPTRARTDADPDFNPDFYRLSMVAPLPNQETKVDDGPTNTTDPVVNAPTNPGISATDLLQNNSNLLQNVGGLASLAGMNTNGSLGGLANFNSSGMENVLNTGLGNIATNQTSLNGLTNGTSEQDQLDALRQRREELVLQLQRMVGNNNNDSVGNANANGMQGLTGISNLGSNFLGNNTNNTNNAVLQNGLGNVGGAMGSLLNQGLNNNTTAQLQQIMGLSGLNGGIGQNNGLFNASNLGSGIGGTGLNNLNMNNLNNLANLNNFNGLNSLGNLTGNLNSLTNNFGNALGNSGLGSSLGNLGGGLAGFNQQLLMQNGMGSNSNALGSLNNNNNLGLGSLNNNNNLGLGNGLNNNMMSPNLGAMLQANQFMNQGGNGANDLSNAMNLDNNNNDNNINSSSV